MTTEPNDTGLFFSGTFTESTRKVIMSFERGDTLLQASKSAHIKSRYNIKKTFPPQPIKVSERELIQVSSLTNEEISPLVIKPNFPQLDLSVWAKNNRDWLESKLLKHGGILFRNFNINTPNNFKTFVDSICSELISYTERSTPRTQLSNNLYTSTEFPSDQTIALHNESSYTINWPMKIWFFCLNPASERGETPIADMRKVFQRIDVKIRERFQQKGWMLVRNFGDGFGLSWQNVFHTDSKAMVEQYCRQSKIEFEWKDNNRLRTRQVRPAITRHPKTPAMLWFNHIVFWHISSLEPQLRQMLLAEFKPEDLPYNTYYGDSSEIENSILEEIRAAYQQETIVFPWHQGDILMLDNMLMAHGRNPFTGPRKILTSMGEPFIRIDK